MLGGERKNMQEPKPTIKILRWDYGHLTFNVSCVTDQADKCKSYSVVLNKKNTYILLGNIVKDFTVRIQQYDFVVLFINPAIIALCSKVEVCLNKGS